MAKHLPISFIWATKMDSRQISEIRHVAERRARFGNTKYEIRNGSAIILAIVLTTLLAIIGVLFLLSSRVDSVATSAVGGNEDLKLAVDTVVAQISEVLTLNVPGVGLNGTYYNYPDGNNPWLASLEPNYLGVWPHVTDLYYQLGLNAYNLPANVIYDHNDTAGNSTPTTWFMADADGDGASDSMWVQIPGKMSAKGKPIYAAIRIIDNGGMLNVNTGYKFFDSNSVGSTQLDINLMALSWRPNTYPYDPNAENTLRLARDPSASGLANYENNVIWQYGLPNGAYTPFDISDELEMRYRFVIDQNDTHTRLEAWSKEFPRDPYKLVRRDPFDNSTGANKFDWLKNAYDNGSLDPNYSYRHLATTYNMDRIINPAGQKMFNINSPLNFNKDSIYHAVREALDPCVFSSIDVAQITANLMDYIDGPDYNTSDPRYDPNNNVTVVYDDFNTPHYGFERPCVYISEVAQNFYQPGPNSPGYDANNPDTVYRSYAIELFKPYWEDDEPNGWEIHTMDVDPNGDLIPNATPIVWTGSRRFHVLANINTTIAEAKISIDFNDMPGPNDFNSFDSNNLVHQPQTADINFGGGTAISLWRSVNGSWIKVDEFNVPGSEVNGSSWLEPNMVGFTSRSFERDITPNRCIRKVVSPTMAFFPTIGYMNNYNSGSEMIQAHPANKMFTNIGEIGQLFRTDAYLTNESSTEAEVRLNLAESSFQNLFKCLTVMDPYDHNPIDPNETRIKGRININTAPWFVLAQLPWVSYQNYNLAQAIVNYRDTIHGPFKNIGELMTDANSSINSIGYYEGINVPAPLLTPSDGLGDLFETRDVIFDRISNLITVRSDVFTAYILVRIPESVVRNPAGDIIGAYGGIQKRVIAIFDRSGVKPNPSGGYTGKVKVIAIQEVPDPR